MWPYALSGRLPIVALAGRRPANQLIGRGPIARRAPRRPFPAGACAPMGVCGISARFRALSPRARQVAHALLTRPPLAAAPPRGEAPRPVRLACVKRAASVRPEPGSNSRICLPGRPPPRGGGPRNDVQFTSAGPAPTGAAPRMCLAKTGPGPARLPAGAACGPASSSGIWIFLIAFVFFLSPLRRPAWRPARLSGLRRCSVANVRPPAGPQPGRRPQWELHYTA